MCAPYAGGGSHVKPEDRIGDYEIERWLASGGMAEVYVARRIGPHGFRKRVALKRIRPQFVRDPEFVALFVEEARLAARLTHPHVVQVFDFGEAQRALYLAMELVRGPSLAALLGHAARTGRSIPLDVTLHVALGVARALAYVHALRDERTGEPLGLVHRDVSPGNVLLSADGHVKLGDFGIARVREREAITDDGQVRGKLGYMSPEQVVGRALDGRSDVFTLGTLLAEMLVLRPLFGRGRELDVLLRIRDVDLSVLEEAADRVPRDVRRLLGRLLRKDPAERPPARRVVELLEEIARRRGFAHGAMRLARTLEHMGLAEATEGEPSPTAEVGAWFEPDPPSTERFGEQIGVSPALYRVRLDADRVEGPMSYPKLVRLLVGGKVHSQTAISKGGAPFAPASSFPELRRFVTSPALQWRGEELSRAERWGPLGAARLVPEVFEIVSSARTGVLHLWDHRRRKKLYFVEGRVEFVASTDPSELLGEYLVAHGICLRMEVDMALALLPRYGGHLGDALIGLGVLRPVQLVRAIQTQVREKLLEAFQWLEGSFAFVPEERSQEEVFPLGLDSYEVLRDAVAAAHPTELEAALARDQERVLVPVSTPKVSLGVFRLPAQWTRWIVAIDGRHTVGALLARAGTEGEDPTVAYRALFLATRCGLARLEPLDGRRGERSAREESAA